MKTPITEQQWLGLIKAGARKGLKDSRGRVWESVRSCGSSARPNALRLSLGAEMCEGFWADGEIWTDLEETGHFLFEPALNDPAVTIVMI